VSQPLSTALIQELQRLDSCSVTNAIEAFNVRLRNEGFTDGSIRCVFEDLAPVVGHAVTARIRCSTPPPVGHNYIDRTDWWSYILTIPAPRIVVVEDVDERPGTGAFVGELHANILQALGCVAYATNGAVRDVPAVGKMSFQLFAALVVPSHAFVHLVEFGTPATIAGLTVESGALLYGDRHGMLTIPPSILSAVPAKVDEMRVKEKAVIAFCRSTDFSLDALRTLVRQLE
jgi:4-hydroxy-4-methyl-2-oxoglutarate aldolase